MATYKKLSGTTDNLFVVDAAGNNPGVALKHEAGIGGTASVVSARNQSDTVYVPLRVLNDSGDTDTCMTRGAITSLAGSTDTVKWFKVDFQHQGSSGDHDFTSGTTFPDNSYIVDCRVNVTQNYDAPPNVIKVGWIAAGDTSITNGAGVDLDSGTAIFELPQIQMASTGAPMNIHVRVNESAGAGQGTGEVWVGYIQTPAS
jgi:hypothetical protein